VSIVAEARVIDILRKEKPGVWRYSYNDGDEWSRADGLRVRCFAVFDDEARSEIRDVDTGDVVVTLPYFKIPADGFPKGWTDKRVRSG
jgi:hypothetical protein